MGNAAASFHHSHVSPDVDKKVYAAIGGVGVLCALTVFVEMCEKLGGSTSPNWSALRLMGPQIWLPLNTKEDLNVAIIFLIFSIMYMAACGFLIYGGWKRIRDLGLTWKLTECGVLMYQIIAALITASSFTALDAVLLSLDTVLGVLALIYTRIAESAWPEETPEEPRQQRPRVPSVVDISDEPDPPGVPAREARRSLEAIAGPSGLAGPSGVPRLAGGLQLHEIEDDTDSLEDVAAAVTEPPPPLPPRAVISPRRKKSSVRTAEVTVHSPPENQQDISVDLDKSLESITESASDTSRGSPAVPLRTPPRQRPATEGSEARQEDSPQAPSTSTAEPATAAEQPVVAETRTLQEAASSTGKVDSETQMAAAPTDDISLPLLSTGTSQVPAEAEPTREQPMSTGESEPSQETQSAAVESSSAAAETIQKPSTDVASSLSVADTELPRAEAHSPQVASAVDTVPAAAVTGTGEAESRAATETTVEQPAAGPEVVTEVEEETHM